MADTRDAHIKTFVAPKAWPRSGPWNAAIIAAIDDTQSVGALELAVAATRPDALIAAALG